MDLSLDEQALLDKFATLKRVQVLHNNHDDHLRCREKSRLVQVTCIQCRAAAERLRLAKVNDLQSPMQKDEQSFTKQRSKLCLRLAPRKMTLLPKLQLQAHWSTMCRALQTMSPWLSPNGKRRKAGLSRKNPLTLRSWTSHPHGVCLNRTYCRRQGSMLPGVMHQP